MKEEADNGWVFGEESYLVEDEAGERWISGEAMRKRKFRRGENIFE